MSKTKLERYTSPVVGFVGQYTKHRRRSKSIKYCIVATPPTNQTLILPEGTAPLDNQVAGHMYDVQGKFQGMFKHNDEFVMKPITKLMCGEREMRFYEELQQTNDKILQELRTLVPGYHGTKQIVVNGKQIKCLLLDNITRGLKEPCVMDIKIGRRTWDPLAGAEKIQNENKKYEDCKKDVGFCIPGFQVHKISQIDAKLEKFGKDYGKQLNGETVKDALKLFLNADSGLNRLLILQILGLLWRILNWCRKQKKLRLYSSSLLIVYDARILRQIIKNPPTNNTSFNSNGRKYERSLSALASDSSWKRTKLQRTHSFNNNYDLDLQDLKQNYVCLLDDLISDSGNLWVNVKMIDFAHVFPAEGNSLDTNYLQGIENLVKIFECLLQESV